MTYKIILNKGQSVLFGRDNLIISGVLTKNWLGFKGEVDIKLDFIREPVVFIPKSPIKTDEAGLFQANIVSDYTGYSKPPHKGPLQNIDCRIIFTCPYDTNVYAEYDIIVEATDIGMK